jgi:adenine-specific DNA-methyltransferase
MSVEQKTTGNIQPPNKDLEILKQNFPNCFDKGGNLDFEKFKKQLSKNEINFSKESYGMDWLGKSYARLLATDETTTLLKEDEVFNQKNENKNSENLLIKGDNLEVLKHLSNAYYEKIKMIYIDPPYNTGSDGFVYADDRKFTLEELQELAGINEERAKRILDFTESNSNSHSAWLTFMYPRLYIAKQLLKEDGIIFISIDANEVAQLRLLMDEIFGEENFVGEIIWKNVTDNNPSNIATEHEYISVYSKNKNKIKAQWKSKLSDVKDILISIGNELIKENKNKYTLQKEYTKWFRENKSQLKELDRYKYIDEGGVYTGSQSVHNPGKDGYRYDIIHPETELPCKEPLMGYRFPETTMAKLLDEGKILFGNDHNKIIELKVYAKDYQDKLSSVNNLDGRLGAYDLRKLFPTIKQIFTNPKPVELVLKYLSFIISDSDLVLDFFAGSGTTADAVMQLNAEDGGKRKFILAQLPELIDKKKNKDAYDFVKNELKAEEMTIFEITKERLIRASKKIQEDNQIAKEPRDLSKQDLGFKVFETMPIWEDYNFESEELDAKQMQLFDESKLTKEDIKSLLVTWKTYDGVSLSQTIKDTDLNGYTGHYSNEKLYLMNKGFKTENLKALLEKIDGDKGFNPTTIIAFGYHFESKNLREISENIKSYANKKNIDIDFITRY